MKHMLFLLVLLVILLTIALPKLVFNFSMRRVLILNYYYLFIFQLIIITIIIIFTTANCSVGNTLNSLWPLE